MWLKLVFSLTIFKFLYLPVSPHLFSRCYSKQQQLQYRNYWNKYIYTNFSRYMLSPTIQRYSSNSEQTSLLTVEPKKKATISFDFFHILNFLICITALFHINFRQKSVFSSSHCRRCRKEKRTQNLIYFSRKV